MTEPSFPPSQPPPLPNLDLELPEHGTGARAARRAAQAAAASLVGAAAANPGTANPGTANPAPRAAPSTPTPEARPKPAPGPTADRPGAGGPSRRWMMGFSAVLGAAVLAAGGLTYVGVQTLQDSSTGRSVTSANPTQPGFEGLLEPTPTLLVVEVHDGVLSSAALLSLAKGDAGGSVLLLPPSVEVGDGRDAATLSVTYAFASSPDVLRGAGEAIAGVGVEDMVVVDDARWTALVAPVAPLVIDNPGPVGEFPAGRIELPAPKVAAWLAARRSGEGEVAVLYRQQLLWQAWIAAVAATKSPSAVPGELDAGLGRFVRGLAKGPVRVETIPVRDVIDGAGNHVFPVDRDALRRIITDLVPFPTGTALAPRTRVRLLDGTGKRDHVQEVAPTVVASDSTIVVVGNADRFDYRTTQIRYHQPDQRAAAERLQKALGAGRVVEDVRPIDSFDVTIVLGTDT